MSLLVWLTPPPFQRVVGQLLLTLYVGATLLFAHRYGPAVPSVPPIARLRTILKGEQTPASRLLQLALVLTILITVTTIGYAGTSPDRVTRSPASQFWRRPPTALWRGLFGGRSLAEFADSVTVLSGRAAGDVFRELESHRHIVAHGLADFVSDLRDVV